MGIPRSKGKSRSRANKPKGKNFEYSCFISYRHGEGEVMQGFIQQFNTAVQSELELHSHLPVFIDRERFSGGTKLNRSLAQALCKSACMILIYTPRYFAEDSTYCTREFLAMRELENIRMKLVSSRTKSFIIPVILRGRSNFPKNIFGENEKVIYCDFEKFDLTDKRIVKNPKFYKLIRQIAQHIIGRINEFSLLDPCEGCDRFNFPTENIARTWRKNNFRRSGPRFPLE